MALSISAMLLIAGIYRVMAVNGKTRSQLRAVHAALRERFRARKVGILYDDAYGLWTEYDQASAAEKAFALLDQEPRRHEPS